MSKEKNTKKNTSKKTKVIKEQDVIKKSDYEDSNENKKILIVALVLALLIGGFAYIRSLSEKEEGNEIEEIIEKEDDEEEVEYLEDRPDVGITVDEGDDMSPIIVNADEIEANAEVIYHMFDDDNKSDVVEYPINIRNNESEEENIEIL